MTEKRYLGSATIQQQFTALVIYNFRNHFKAFGPNSDLHVKIKFTQSEVKTPVILILRLYHDKSNETCSVTRTTFWTRGYELVSLFPCKHILASGFWNLQGKLYE